MFIQYSGNGRAVVRFFAICKLFIFHSYTYYFLNYFSKSGSGWVGGIENVYHDPCQDWMDLINMELKSPNYPQPYDLGTHCIWNIIAPPGHYVTLDFERISVSNIKRCYFLPT